MNQDQVKEALKGLRPTVPEFQVIYSGKASRKVNGLYKPESADILLHNKNFNSDQELLYTAIHEFAHHLHFTSEAPPGSSRCHTKAFWLICHGLMTEAIEAGLYVPVVDQELSAAVADVRSSMKQEAEALKNKGQALLALVQQCGKHHIRFEDYMDRVLGISRLSAKTAMAAFAQDVSTDGGADQVKLLVSVRDPEVRRELQVEGLTLVEKQAAATGVVLPAPSSSPEPIQSGARIRARLEARLARLEEEAEAIRTKIQDLEDGVEEAAAHPKDAQLRFCFDG